MEKSLSTFANEMATCAMILGVCTNTEALTQFNRCIGIATADSLVLVDEVGRGTSPEEGVGIAHALAEALIKIQVLIFHILLFGPFSAIFPVLRTFHHVN